MVSEPRVHAVNRGSQIELSFGYAFLARETFLGETLPRRGSGAYVTDAVTKRVMSDTARRSQAAHRPPHYIAGPSGQTWTTAM